LGEVTDPSQWHIAELQKGIADSLELVDRMPDLLHHVADFPIFPLVQNHLDLGVFFGGPQDTNLARGRP
jgi:hypothetical protein